MGEGNNYRDDVFSTSVRAGKRTYFFDVKATRGNDLFMTITESKRAGMDENGHLNFEKHKIFLYKEDFEKFIGGLQDAIDHIKQLQDSGQYRSMENERRPYNSEDDHQDEGHGETAERKNYSSNAENNGVSSAGDVSFDDL